MSAIPADFSLYTYGTAHVHSYTNIVKVKFSRIRLQNPGYFPDSQRLKKYPLCFLKVALTRNSHFIICAKNFISVGVNSASNISTPDTKIKFTAWKSPGTRARSIAEIRWKPPNIHERARQICQNSKFVAKARAGVNALSLGRYTRLSVRRSGNDDDGDG